MADDHKLRQLDPTGEQGYAAWTLKQRPTALSCLRALQKKLSSSRQGTPDWASGTAWVADRHHLVTRIATPPSGDAVAAQHVPAASPHGGASAGALTKPAGAPPAAVAAQAAQPAALVGAAPAQLPAAAAAAGLQADLQGQQVRAVQTQHAPPAEQVAVVAEAPPPPPTAAAPLAASSGALQAARRACDMQKRRADNLQAALEASRVEIAQLHNCVAGLLFSHRTGVQQDLDSVDDDAVSTEGPGAVATPPAGPDAHADCTDVVFEVLGRMSADQRLTVAQMMWHTFPGILALLQKHTPSKMERDRVAEEEFPHLAQWLPSNHLWNCRSEGNVGSYRKEVLHCLTQMHSAWTLLRRSAACLQSKHCAIQRSIGSCSLLRTASLRSQMKALRVSRRNMRKHSSRTRKPRKCCLCPVLEPRSVRACHHGQG